LKNIPAHPHIIQFHYVRFFIQIREFSNYIILAIENVKGGSLQKVMRDRKLSG